MARRAWGVLRGRHPLGRPKQNQSKEGFPKHNNIFLSPWNALG